jgi:hypothetical protein
MSIARLALSDLRFHGNGRVVVLHAVAEED